MINYKAIFVKFLTILVVLQALLLINIWYIIDNSFTCIESDKEVKVYSYEPLVLSSYQPPSQVIEEPEEIEHPDTYILAQIISAEAKGEPYEGKLAVGNVIMNRLNDDWYPDTIEGIIFQKGQFSPVTDGSIYDEPTEESIEAAKEVLNGVRVLDDKALYFYNPKTSTSKWIFTRTTLVDIGNHRFAY